MTPKLTLLTPGKLAVSVYDFASPGDVLPMHNHDEATAHITLVMKGSVLVRTPDKSSVYVVPDILDFPAGEPHEFEAVEAGTRIANVVKGVA